jgi:hypothetical protein
MKTAVLISLLLSFFQEVRSQDKVSPNYFFFENPNTRRKTPIETGSKIVVSLKGMETNVTGIVLSFTDSTLYLGINRKPYRLIVLTRIITNIRVITQTPKRHVVLVKLNNGKKITGELIYTTVDTIRVVTTSGLHPLSFGAAEIKTIRIRRKGSVGRGIGIGAASGFMLGIFIGAASYSPPPPCSPNSTPFCLDLDLGPAQNEAVGALIGTAAGTILGAVAGASTKKFDVDGSVSQFQQFALEFKNQGLKAYGETRIK